MIGDERYYSPAEVRERLGVSRKQLRYWRELRLIVPRETVGRHARYSEADLVKMRLCVALMERSRLTLHEAMAAVRVVAEVGTACNLAHLDESSRTDKREDFYAPAD